MSSVYVSISSGHHHIRRMTHTHMLGDLCVLSLTAFHRNIFLILHMETVFFETSDLSFKNLFFKFKDPFILKFVIP